MRPWIVFLCATVKQFDITVKDLQDVGLTQEEIEVLMPSMLEKVSCPKMTPNYEDTELRLPKFAPLKKIANYEKFQDAYLLTKRSLKGTGRYEESLQDLLSMIFFISDVIDRPDHPDKPHMIETFHLFRELTLEMHKRPTKLYTKAAYQMEECLKSAVLH